MVVCVIDDEKDMALLFKQFFKSQIKVRDIEFNIFEHSDEAFVFLDKRYCESEKFIVLLDLNLEREDGLNVLSRIKEKYPSAVVYIMTGSDNQGVCELCDKKGADGFIAKPFDLETIKKIVN
jgi:hypothetical protein